MPVSTILPSIFQSKYEYERRKDEYERMKNMVGGFPVNQIDLDSLIQTTKTELDFKSTSSESLQRAILMRMRSGMNFDHWHPVYIASKSKVVVFIIHDGKPTHIEDDWDLFPSDALITKLRLLLG